MKNLHPTFKILGEPVYGEEGNAEVAFDDMAFCDTCLGLVYLTRMHGTTDSYWEWGLTPKSCARAPADFDTLSFDRRSLKTLDEAIESAGRVLDALVNDALVQSHKKKLTIEFDNDEALHHFALWLCEHAEQDYWEWMKVRETEECGPITATSFRYHPILDAALPLDDPNRYGPFLADNVIRTECGRLEDD